MNFLYQFSQDLFSWCNGQGISIALARPKFLIENFADSDLDLLVQAPDIDKIMVWVKQSNFVTCHYKRSDGSTYHIGTKSGEFFHIDFITSLENRGINYLKIKDVIDRRFVQNNIYYPDPVDQFIILIMTHVLKHKNQDKISKYYPFLQSCLKENLTAIQEELKNILGDNQAVSIINAIKNDETIGIFYTNFIIAAWQTYGLTIFGQIFLYFLNEIYRRLTMKKYKIVFLGVDGSGKTTLINVLKRKFKNAFPAIKHCHFMPALPWQSEKDSNIVQSDPHNKKNRSYFMSIIKLKYFYMRYWIAELYPIRKPTLYFYDRYIYDLAVDPKRFRYNGPKALWWIFKLFPKPDITFIIDVAPQVAQSRKQEVSPQETIRQTTTYLDAKDNLPNVLVINNDFALDKIIPIAEKYIIKNLIEFNETK